jgi:hypothetical protein
LDSTQRVLSRGKGFDRDERKRQLRGIFPTDRRASLEQQLAARVFRSSLAKPLHGVLMQAILLRG